MIAREAVLRRVALWLFTGVAVPLLIVLVLSAGPVRSEPAPSVEMSLSTADAPGSFLIGPIVVPGDTLHP